MFLHAIMSTVKMLLRQLTLFKDSDELVENLFVYI